MIPSVLGPDRNHIANLPPHDYFPESLGAFWESLLSAFRVCFRLPLDGRKEFRKIAFVFNAKQGKIGNVSPQDNDWSLDFS